MASPLNHLLAGLVSGYGSPNQVFLYNFPAKAAGPDPTAIGVER